MSPIRAGLVRPFKASQGPEGPYKALKGLIRPSGITTPAPQNSIATTAAPAVVGKVSRGPKALTGPLTALEGFQGLLKGLISPFGALEGLIRPLRGP